jgi:hypothetical protein
MKKAFGKVLEVDEKAACVVAVRKKEGCYREIRKAMALK